MIFNAQLESSLESGLETCCVTDIVKKMGGNLLKSRKLNERVNPCTLV